MVDHLGVVPSLRDIGTDTHRSHSGKYRSSSDCRSSERSGSHSGGRGSEDSVSHHLCCFLFTLVSVSQCLIIEKKKEKMEWLLRRWKDKLELERRRGRILTAVLP